MNANPAIPTHSAPERPAPAPGFDPVLALAFAARFSVIIAALVALIARSFLRHPSLAPLIVPLCGRLNRAARRLAAIMSRHGAPRRDEVSDRGAPSRPESGAASSSPRRNPEPSIPTTQAWLVHTLLHEAAAYRSQLAHLLSEPGISELLDAAPSARRLLRPLARMLGLPDTALRAVARQAACAPLRTESVVAPDTPPTGVARQATGAPSRTESGGAVFYPPPCPHLRLRWPWYTKPNPNPA